MANNLELMFNNGMKNLGAFQMGQQQSSDREVQAQKLRQMMLEAQGTELANQQSQVNLDQSKVMNPLQAQFRQGEIDAQSAGLPGIVGQSQTLKSQGDIAAATTSMQIAQRISSLGNQIGVDGMQKLSREGQFALSASKALAQYPPALHQEVLGKMAEAYGIDPNSGVVKTASMAPPGQAAKMLATVGQGMVMATGEYMQQSAENAKNRASSEKIAGGNNATSIKVAEIGASARLQAAQLRAQQMANSLGIDKAIAQYEMQKAQSGGQLPPEDEQALQNLKTQQLQSRAAGANAVPATVLGMPTPMDNARNAATGGAPAPQAPASAAGNRTVTRTGTSNGRKVVQYSDGSIEYAN